MKLFIESQRPGFEFWLKTFGSGQRDIVVLLTRDGNETILDDRWPSATTHLVIEDYSNGEIFRQLEHLGFDVDYLPRGVGNFASPFTAPAFVTLNNEALVALSMLF